MKSKSAKWLLSCTVLVSLGSVTPATNTVAAECLPPALTDGSQGQSYQLLLGACNSLTRSGTDAVASAPSDTEE